MNILIVQYDIYFLLFTKNKFKLLVQKDTTVSLHIDEIDLRPYFDYKGGNIVGLSYHSSNKWFCFYA